MTTRERNDALALADALQVAGQIDESIRVLQIVDTLNGKGNG